MRFTYKSLIKISVMVLFTSSFVINKQDSYRSEQVPGIYLEYSSYTNPGEFVYLYDNLPGSIEDICDVIKKQLVHPFEIEKYGDKIPGNRVHEDRSIPTVEQMLKELLIRDNSGLVLSRQPEDRLVVACVHHSLLLASILRYKGIPTRLRAGNAKYIGDDSRFRVTHVICEIWDKQSNKWELVDPDRHKINFNRKEFEFASETWEKIRENDINKKFYISRYKSVVQASAHLVCLDLSYVIGTEEPYWNDPPIVTKIKKSTNDISKDELILLDKISKLLKNPDPHLDELKYIKNNNQTLDYD